MNTSAGYYQAPRPPRVPLDEVLIKLHPEGFHQEFEADGINVGSGGISMRASVLPQVGSTLRCQLETPRGGESIEMIGRVVWAHEDGPHAGEFGIRFTHLSDRDQTRIETLIQSWGRTSAKAPTVRLHLDGVGSQIVAEIQSEHATGLSVEQPLPFLAIGSAVLNETAGRRGHLEAVELKMDESTPKLVLSIGYEVSDVVGSDLGEAEARDTLPDETPPSIRTHAAAPEEAREEDRPRIVRYDQETDEAPTESITEQLQMHASAAWSQVVTVTARARDAVTGRLVPGIRRRAGELYALISRFIAALRARLDDKPRRKQVPRSQAARAHLKNTRRNHRRYLIVGLMACAIVAAGWLTYSWAASGPETESAEETAAADEVEMAPSTERGSQVAVETASAKLAGAPSASEEATASATRHAAQGAPLPPETVRGLSFGAEAVPGGEKHVLRMSNEVTEMEGILEDDGFSVTIPGALSLSRAGPIAAAHSDVEHASILNRGDFSELTVRFVAGRRPPYRVEAQGAAIEITIAR